MGRFHGGQGGRLLWCEAAAPPHASETPPPKRPRWLFMISRRASHQVTSPRRADARSAPCVCCFLRLPLLSVRGQVSSTSWTPDEDFGLLLEAARLYDAKARSAESAFVFSVNFCECNRRAPAFSWLFDPPSPQRDPPRVPSAQASKAGSGLPRLLVIVTGKGPLRHRFEAQMRALQLRTVALRTAWLEAADYPRLLAAADLGVSLHASSSGLDLPMKASGAVALCSLSGGLREPGVRRKDLARCLGESHPQRSGGSFDV